jgi:hypothetical protein
MQRSVSDGRKATAEHGSALRAAPHRPGHDGAGLLHLQNLAGNRAVTQLVRGEGLPLMVSRIMTGPEFKAITAQKGIRWKVRSVDKALQAYRDKPVDDAAGRLEKADALVAAGETYLGHEDRSASRKPGVMTLLGEARLEQQMYSAYAQAEASNDRVQKLTMYNLALDRQIIARRHHDLETLSFTTKVRAVMATMTPAEKQQVVNADLTRLQDLVADPTLPGLTRQILTELLANAPDVRLQAGAPGAKKKRPWEAQAENYTVEHNMEQGGGSTERLGSLAHELTHVAVGESYGNSSFFFMIGSDATGPEIVAKATGRRARIAELRTALAAQHRLAADQVALVNSKLDYGAEDKLPLYMARYGDAADQALRDGNTPAHQQKAAWYRQQAAKARFVCDALGGTGLTSSLLVEYDTVVNQMLVYMHQWRVPLANPFYAKLREVGQEVSDERADARAPLGALFD